MSGVHYSAGSEHEQPPTPSADDEVEIESNFLPTGMTSPVSSRPWDMDDDNSLFSEDEEIVRISEHAGDAGYAVESDDDSFEIIEDSDSD